MLKNHKLLVQGGLSVIVVMKDIIFIPRPLRIILHIISFMVSSFALKLIHDYYKSVPVARQTALTYCMRLLMILGIVFMIWYTIAVITVEFPKLIDPYFASYPNLTCCVLRAEIMLQFIVLLLFLILCLQAYLNINPMKYLSLNHEHLFLVIFIIFIVTSIVELVIMFWVSGTYCSKTKWDRLIYGNKILVPKDKIKWAPKLFVMNCVFCAVPQIAIIMNNLIKKHFNNCKIGTRKQIKPKKVSHYDHDVLSKRSRSQISNDRDESSNYTLSSPNDVSKTATHQLPNKANHQSDLNKVPERTTSNSPLDQQIKFIEESEEESNNHSSQEELLNLEELPVEQLIALQRKYSSHLYQNKRDFVAKNHPMVHPIRIGIDASKNNSVTKQYSNTYSLSTSNLQDKLKRPPETRLIFVAPQSPNTPAAAQGPVESPPNKIVAHKKSPVIVTIPPQMNDPVTTKSNDLNMSLTIAVISLISTLIWIEVRIQETYHVIFFFFGGGGWLVL